MPKIRIKTMMIDGEMRPTKKAISLGSKMIEQPKVMTSRDNAGKEIEQRIPGRATCVWLVPPGMVSPGSYEVDVADVPDDMARILVDERGWCERVPGRPRSAPTEA